MIIPMERQKITSIALLFLVVVGFKPSIGARQLENGLFISPDNPSAFDPKLNSVAQGTGTSLGSGSGSGSDAFKDPKEKTLLPCAEPGRLAFRFKENAKSEEVVLNVLAKGSVTPSGPSHRGNDGILSAQRLAKSKHSPGVGHMQIFNTKKSGVTDRQHQQRGSNERILKSTPSPGAGH